MVRQFLKEGKENAVSLGYLASAMKMNKRSVRDMISKVNESGEDVICTDAQGRGYYLASNRSEAMAYRRYNHSYGASILRKEKGIDRCIRTKFSTDELTKNQISLADLGLR